MARGQSNEEMSGDGQMAAGLRSVRRDMSPYQQNKKEKTCFVGSSQIIHLPGLSVTGARSGGHRKPPVLHFSALELNTNRSIMLNAISAVYARRVDPFQTSVKRRVLGGGGGGAKKKKRG